MIRIFLGFLWELLVLVLVLVGLICFMDFYMIVVCGGSDGLFGGWGW